MEAGSKQAEQASLGFDEVINLEKGRRSNPSVV
jgi:hypothetical protein